MYHVSAHGVDERMINVHYYYYYSDGLGFICGDISSEAVIKETPVSP